MGSFYGLDALRIPQPSLSVFMLLVGRQQPQTNLN